MVSLWIGEEVVTDGSVQLDYFSSSFYMFLQQVLLDFSHLHNNDFIM